MNHDGSNPLTDALGDMTQKGAGLAAIAVQLLSEKQRQDAASRRRLNRGPGDGSQPQQGTGLAASQLHAGPGQDYLTTQRRWKDAFQLDFAAADGSRAMRIWLESSQHAQLYPSASEAMELAGRRLRELDPGFMDGLDRRLAAGTNPVLALESTAGEQLQLPAGRSNRAEIAAAEREVEEQQRRYEAACDQALAAAEREVREGGNPAEIERPSDWDLFKAQDRLDRLMNPYTVEKLSVLGDGDWYEQSRHATLGEAALEAQALIDEGDRIRVKHEGEVVDRAAVEEAYENEPAVSREEVNRALGVQTAPAPDTATIDPAREGQRQAAAGLSADEEHAGLVMKGAVDRPGTPQDERVEGLVDSGERLQIAEASGAQAASLTSLAYPHSVETTMAAVHKTPAIRPVPRPGMSPDLRRGRTL